MPALLMRMSIEPACLTMSETHAAMLAGEQTSHVAVLMPSSASCLRLSILWHAQHSL